jgi:hypothetical protein
MRARQANLEGVSADRPVMSGRKCFNPTIEGNRKCVLTPMAKIKPWKPTIAQLCTIAELSHAKARIRMHPRAILNDDNDIIIIF